MTPKKKLQVFVSSTYSDLIEERQAAVEAILMAGHIPAGMELFAAGDPSQMDVIKRWIDESDVFLLILGGRYGSIDPASNKSYIQLEYEYALEKGKQFFALVIDENYLKERVKYRGIDVLEHAYPRQLKDFRKTVLTRLVRFWNDRKDIVLAVLSTLSEFGRRDDLVGWIPGDQAVNTGALAEAIARLAKENASLQAVNTVALAEEIARRIAKEYASLREHSIQRYETTAANQQQDNPKRNRIFVSYSHDDRKLFNEFRTMMDPAIQKGIVDMWDDTKITIGARWKQEIEKALASTKVAVLLVSQKFLASRFITKNELPQLLHAAEKEGVRVFWIYFSSCLYEQTDIANYQAAHDLKRPLDQRSKPDRQAILSQVCAELIRLAGARVD
jgi:hypothetical protein